MMEPSGARMRFPSKLLMVCVVIMVTWSESSADVLTEIRFHFEEQKGPNSYVGNVAVESGLRASMTASEFAKLSFGIDEGDIQYFTIDPNSGELHSFRTIDREAVCQDREKECKLTTEITVYSDSGTGLYTFITAIVVIDDINDNAPEFPTESLELRVPEGNGVGDMLYISVAVDKDTGNNSVKQYSFRDPSNTFFLREGKNPDGSSYLGIVIKEVLDREIRDFYQVTVTAKDGGTPPKSDSMVVNITVTDINDNEPEFLKPVYNQTIDENLPVNVTVLQVSARDDDINQNAEISYKFGSSVSGDVRQKLKIIEHTGEVIIQKEIDYENKQDQQFLFSVLAVDHGSPPKTATVRVILNIRDVNDNAPEINVNPSSNDVYLSESTGIDTVIVQVTVNDIDEGVNSIVYCDLDEPHFSLQRLQSLQANQYKVVLAKPLDYEQAPSYRVSIECMDNGQPELSSVKTFVVNVNDENDNRPKFTHATYYGRIVENTLGTRNVVNVTAYDGDSGEFGRVSYSLENKYASLFTINDRTGQIYITRPVDREKTPVFEFHVIARDNSPDRLSNSSLIVINVEDENDEPPEFPRPVYYGDVLENQPVGTSVGNVTAVDPDLGVNATVVYAIVKQGSDYDNFSINRVTGIIRSTVAFDREDRDQYRFKIRAEDARNPAFYAICNFTVRILDDNDHDPIIHKSTVENSTMVVDYASPVGSVITTIRAYDGDDPASKYSELTFLIAKGDPEELFNLNRYTGKLTLARMIGRKDIRVHHLKIKVQDGGSPPNFDMKRLNIRINGTFPADGDGSLDRNILIAAIIIAVTVVVALAIIIAICIMRCIGKERRANRAQQKTNEEKMYQEKQQDLFTNMTSVDGIMEDSNSNNLGKRGRKEVSFSLDEESDSHNTSSGSGHPLTSFKTNSDADKESQIAQNRLSGSAARQLTNGGMNIPVANQEKPSNIRRSPKDEECHLIEILKKSAEDALSESSGETDPSDSGRGGSEDDSSHRGHDKDPNNSNNLYPQVFYRGPGSPIDGKDQQLQHPHQNRAYQQQLLYPPKSSSKSRQQRPGYESPAHHHTQVSSPRNSLSSDVGSDMSSGRTSQARSDSDRSSSHLIQPNSSSNRSDSRRRPPISPNTTNAQNTPAQMIPFRPRENYGPRSLLTHDSPNRLVSPYSNSNSSLMRSFHGNPSNSFQVAPPLHSLSAERLPRHNSDRSYTASERSYPYSDRSYPPSSERWASSLPEEDDRTTTSGSYTINPDELRQEIDHLILRDSIV
ncbi:protocadherin-1 [Aplysia californica]|uniref:Protocadherin-1 n=1 Tax=Aplysia californica TaxID=6500 RepID=A0ABM1A6K8_APLCA|nr:protocadherin-1 [Aplysia californica]